MRTFLLILIIVFSTNILSPNTSYGLSASFPKADTVITAQVEDKIVHNESLSNAHVTIATKDAVVTVTGEVETEDQASLVIQTVQSVAGVKSVNTDGLNVKTKAVSQQ